MNLWRHLQNTHSDILAQSNQAGAFKNSFRAQQKVRLFNSDGEEEEEIEKEYGSESEEEELNMFPGQYGSYLYPIVVVFLPFPALLFPLALPSFFFVTSFSLKIHLI